MPWWIDEGVPGFRQGSRGSAGSGVPGFGGSGRPCCRDSLRQWDSGCHSASCRRWTGTVPIALALSRRRGCCSSAWWSWGCWRPVWTGNARAFSVSVPSRACRGCLDASRPFSSGRAQSSGPSGLASSSSSSGPGSKALELARWRGRPPRSAASRSRSQR